MCGSDRIDDRGPGNAEDQRRRSKIFAGAEAVRPIVGRCRRARAGCEARIVALPGGAWKDGGLARRSAAARLVPRLRRARPMTSSRRRALNAGTSPHRRALRPIRVRRAPGPERQDFCAHCACCANYAHCLTLRSLCSLRLRQAFQDGRGRSRPCRLPPGVGSDPRVGSPCRWARTHRCWP